LDAVQFTTRSLIQRVEFCNTCQHHPDVSLAQFANNRKVPPPPPLDRDWIFAFDATRDQAAA